VKSATSAKIANGLVALIRTLQSLGLWVVGLFCMLAALGALADHKPPEATLMGAMGLLLVPPAKRLVNRKLKAIIPVWGLVLFLFSCFVVLVGHEDTSPDHGPVMPQPPNHLVPNRAMTPQKSVVPRQLPETKTFKIPAVMDWERHYVEQHVPQAAKQIMANRFWGRFAVVAAALVHRISPGGQVTKADLARAVQDASLDGEEAQVAAALYSELDLIHTHLQGFNPHYLDIRNWFRSPAMGSSDMLLVAHVAMTAENAWTDAHNLSTWAIDEGNLRRFARSGADHLTLTDLEAANQRHDLSPQDRARLGELYTRFATLAVGGAIGKEQIQSYFRRVRHADGFRLLDNIQYDMMGVSVNQDNPASHRLYADPAQPLHSIMAEAVYQGIADDCAFRAAEAGLANTRPEEILAMTRIVAPGRFEVRLPGAPGRSLVVPAPTDAELGLFSPINTGGAWSAVLAKAYGLLNAGLSNAKKDQTVAEWAGADGDQDHAIQALTGHKADIFMVNDLSDTAITSKLLTGWKSKRVMTLDITKGDYSSEERTSDGFLKRHGFTVLNVAMVDGHLEVTVRDPHPYGVNTAHGIINITLETIRRNFDFICIETNLQASPRYSWRS
jgi:prepilin-type processing-associated H-X9-DG protein